LLVVRTDVYLFIVVFVVFVVVVVIIVVSTRLSTAGGRR